MEAGAGSDLGGVRNVSGDDGKPGLFCGRSSEIPAADQEDDREVLRAAVNWS